jgi:hypothetical protein
LVLDRAGMLISRIPWNHRREMGRLRAFFKTCWMAFRRPGRIAADMALPANFAEAKRFQRAVILTAFLPIAAFGCWAIFEYSGENPFGPNGIQAPMTYRPFVPSPKYLPMHGHKLGWSLEALGVIFAAICLWHFLKSITGVASYFFHPRELSIPRQNRAIALSYYACAPLAWTPISVALYAAILLVESKRWADGVLGAQFHLLLQFTLLISVLVQLVGWWIVSLAILKKTTRCGIGRVFFAGASLPALWSICAVLTLGLLPAAYVFTCAVIISLM